MLKKASPEVVIRKSDAEKTQQRCTYMGTAVDGWYTSLTTHHSSSLQVFIELVSEERKDGGIQRDTIVKSC